MSKYIISALSIFLFCAPAFADAPVIKNVKAREAAGMWTFDVTVAHVDTGWDDYANGWRIVDMNGKELGIRNLAHPHVDEQPFTRSLSGVKIGPDVTEVGIQVSDSIGGWSSSIKKVQLR